VAAVEGVSRCVWRVVCCWGSVARSSASVSATATFVATELRSTGQRHTTWVVKPRTHRPSGTESNGHMSTTRFLHSPVCVESRSREAETKSARSTQTETAPDYKPPPDARRRSTGHLKNRARGCPVLACISTSDAKTASRPRKLSHAMLDTIPLHTHSAAHERARQAAHTRGPVVINAP
jgi:hypothetical protein